MYVLNRIARLHILYIIILWYFNKFHPINVDFQLLFTSWQGGTTHCQAVTISVVCYHSISWLSFACKVCSNCIWSKYTKQLLEMAYQHHIDFAYHLLIAHISTSDSCLLNDQIRVIISVMSQLTVSINAPLFLCRPNAVYSYLYHI